MIHRIVISNEGKPSNVLRLEERPDGTVNVAIRHATNFTYGKVNETYTHPEQVREIKNQYYSFHPSMNSPHTMTFKHHIQFEVLNSAEKEEIITQQVTQAIKNGNSTLIFAKLCQDYSDIKYHLKPRHTKDKLVTLGTYIPKKKTLVYFVLVSPPNNNFRFKNTEVTKYKDIKFEHFTITILYTFLSQPSTPDSEIKHVVGYPKDINIFKNPSLQLGVGQTPIEIHNMVQIILEQFIKVHCQNFFCSYAINHGIEPEDLMSEENKSKIEKFIKECKPSANGW